jgi:polar amino acid transport system substrate-binding protein
MKRLIAAVLIALGAVALASCGSGASGPQQIALRALSMGPPSPPAPTKPAPPPPHCGGDVTASLRPPAALPAPGSMPAGSFMAAIHSHGHLTAGVDQNTLLFGYFNPLHGQIEGFEIDLVHRLAQAIFGDKSAVVFKAITTAERIPAVQSGSVDIVADAMTITCSRRQQVDFSTVYYDAHQKILVPVASPAQSVADLARKRVCATKGSTSIDTLQHHVPAPRPVAYPVAQRTDCLVALQEGRVDGVTSDDAILLGFKAQDPYTKIVGPSLGAQPYGMAISRAHPEFVRFVNGVLAQMRADGSWRSTFSQWLGRFGPTPAPPAPHYSG